jgi:hypothetical protein
LDYHLSYPFIFRAGGGIFMVPESSANRTIELFVAEDFPSRWRRYCVLMSELEAHDTTLFRDETGLWWMFTTLVRVGELGWDSVSVFYAESLFGPWHPHPMNPVRNDVRSSRSGGAVFSVAGRVFRPVQDCSQGYGSALAFCEIVELSPTRFREVVTKGPLRASAPPFLGVHTFNRSGQIEAMDFKHLRRRFAGLGEIQLPDRAALEAVESASPLPKVKFA